MIFKRILISLLIPFTAQAGSVAVWKYSGEDFRSVQFVSLKRSEAGDWSRGASVYVNEKGLSRYSPYASTYGEVKPTSPDERWRRNPVHREIEAHGENAKEKLCSLLLMNQTFPMRVMIERKAIEEGLSYELLESSLKLDPDQVTFIESVEAFPEGVIKRKWGEIPQDSRPALNPYAKNSFHEKRPMTYHEFSDYIRSFDYGEGAFAPETAAHKLERLKEEQVARREERQAARDYYDVKMASMWMISGQTPKGLRALPAENHSTQILERVIDRKKFPHIWEFGRLAQVESGHLNTVIEAALLQIQSEAALLGADLKKSFVFAHALDEAHSRLYQSAFGLKPFSGYVGDTEGKVLYISVAELMEKIKMKNTISGRKVQATKLRQSLKNISRVQIAPTNEVVQFRDFSDLNRSEGWVPPSISDLDALAHLKGAHSRNGAWNSAFLPAERRMDLLPERMDKYYDTRDNYGRYPMWDRPTGEQELNRKFYVRARYYDLKAWVVDFDPAIAEHLDEFSGSALHQTLDLTDQTIQMRKGALTAEPENIAFLVRGGLSKEWQDILKELDTKEEVIYFDPVIRTTKKFSRFFQHEEVTGGDSLILVWFPYSNLKAKLKSGAFPSDPELGKKMGIQRKIEERYWGRPIPGT